MQNFVHADIFFFVSTMLFVCVGALMAVVLYYVIQIVRDVHLIVRAARGETEDVLRDLKVFRETMREEGLRFRHIIGFVFGRFFGMGGVKKKKSKAKAAAEESEDIE